jgi:hypothetical protein
MAYARYILASSWRDGVKVRETCSPYNLVGIRTGNLPDTNLEGFL